MVGETVQSAGEEPVAFDGDGLAAGRDADIERPRHGCIFSHCYHHFPYPSTIRENHAVARIVRQMLNLPPEDEHPPFRVDIDKF